MNKPIDIVRDPKRKCCATCSHAKLVSYGPTDPLLAECTRCRTAYNSTRPYVVMVANGQVCRQHSWRKTPEVIEYRQKKIFAA